MKIILNQDVIHVGEEGDVVVVKDGYARNYLLPNGLAVVFNKANEARFKARAKQIEEKKAIKRAQSAETKEKLDNLSVDLVVSAGESGKLFGSVTAQMVQDALLKEGFDIDKKKIDVQSHAIKMTGTYTVLIHLYENDSSHIKINVKSEAQVKAEEKAKAEEEKKKRAEEEKLRKAQEEAEKKAQEEVEKAEAETKKEIIAEAEAVEDAIRDEAVQKNEESDKE